MTEKRLVSDLSGASGFDGDLTDPTSYTEEMKDSLVDKVGFYQKLNEYYKSKNNKVPFARQKLDKLMEELQIAKRKRFRKDRREYFILSTYDTAVVDGKLQVIKKSDKLPLIPFEDLYDIIFEYHIKTNHGGKTKLENAYRIGKVSIPRPATETFLICCKICFAKRNAPKKIQVEKPKYAKGFSHKGQVDIIDFQKMPDGCYNMILCYQDYYTKFLVLKPLENDNMETISKELLNIFMTFGPPTVLESYNGKYFVTKILKSINSSWVIPTIAQGEPKETPNTCKTPDEIESLVKHWLELNYSKKWVAGLNFVQWQQNSRYDPKLSRCAYQALFGVEPLPELCTSSDVNYSSSTIQHPSSTECPDSSTMQGDVPLENVSTLSSDEDVKPTISMSEEDLSFVPNTENCYRYGEIDMDDENSSFKRLKVEIEDCNLE